MIKKLVSDYYYLIEDNDYMRIVERLEKVPDWRSR